MYYLSLEGTYTKNPIQQSNLGKGTQVKMKEKKKRHRNYATSPKLHSRDWGRIQMKLQDLNSYIHYIMFSLRPHWESSPPPTPKDIKKYICSTDLWSPSLHSIQPKNPLYFKREFTNK